MTRRIDHYEIEDELGRGGMGAVYLARDLELDRRVAIKLMLDPGDAEGCARFQREAEALALVQDPTIVTVHRVGQDAGRPYLVMEYVEGESLQAVLRRDGPLAPQVAARHVATIARAIERAHASGVLHRDLKPENILLEKGGRLRLTDFGLAHLALADRLTQTGTVVGTPGYMAPEQVTGDRNALGPAVDVYGLGASLYALLTGSPPCAGATVANVLLAVLERPPRPPRQLRAGIPEDLERICLRCLEKPPTRRYPSAAALADDLDRFLEGRPIPGFKRPVRWRWLGVGAALVGAVGVGFAAAALDPVGPAEGVAARPRPSATEPGLREVPVAAAIPGPSPSLPASPGAGGSEYFSDPLFAAGVLVENGELRDALRMLDGAIAQEPSAEAHRMRGACRVRLGEWATAVPDYREWARLAKGEVARAEALRTLSTALRQSKQFPEALTVVQEALLLTPDDAACHDVLAQALWVNGQKVAAVESFTRSLDLDAAPPNLNDILRNRGRLLKELSRFREAFVDLDRLIKEFDEGAKGYGFRGEVRAALGDLDGALEDLTTALEKDPEGKLINLDRVQSAVNRLRGRR